MNTALEGKEWLAGNSVSVADVIVASAMLVPFQTVLDGGFRKAMKNVTSWAERVYGLPEFKSVFGNV